MQVGFLQKLIIMLRLMLVSIKGPSLVILGSISKNSRMYADRAIHAWAQSVLRILKVQYKILNPHNLEFGSERPYIIMSNHLSLVDIPLIYAAFPHDSIGMLAKKELFRIPIFGLGMKLGGCVSIDRENRQQAMKDLATAKATMLSGIRLWLAPEGTRSRSGNMGAFKRGGFKLAFETKAIIIPVTIVGSNKVLPVKTFNFSLNESVEVYISQPIDTAHYQFNELQKLVRDTTQAIAAKL